MAKLTWEESIFPLNILTLRAHRGITQKDLAAVARRYGLVMSNKKLSRIENLEQAFTPDEKKMLAAILGYPVEELDTEDFSVRFGTGLDYHRRYGARTDSPA